MESFKMKLVEVGGILAIILQLYELTWVQCSFLTSSRTKHQGTAFESVCYLNIYHDQIFWCWNVLFAIFFVFQLGIWFPVLTTTMRITTTTIITMYITCFHQSWFLKPFFLEKIGFFKNITLIPVPILTF